MQLTIEQALQQGVAAHKEGKLQEAERLYRAVLQEQPAHPDANHNLGILAVAVNKIEVALPLFKTALEANPKIEQFWVSYINALIKENQFDTAKEVLEQAKNTRLTGEKVDALEAQFSTITQKENSKNSTLSQQKLSILAEHYQAGQYADAEQLAVSITQEFPEHQFGWKVLGALFHQTGRKAEALNANQKAIQIDPQDAETHNNLSVILKEQGRLEEAAAGYRQAIALKLDFVEAHNNLGNALQELGRLEDAEASLRQAIALKLDFAEAHNNLGNTLKELGRLEESETSCRQAIALKSDYTEAYNNLGVTLKELGRLDEAEASYRQAIELRSDYAEAHCNLGDVLQELGRLEEGEASCRQAIELRSDYAEAHNNLGVTLKELGRLGEAEASFRQGIELKTDYAEAYYNLGNTLKELGRLEKGEASYRQAIVLKTDFADAHNNLGMTLKELGRLDEAEASYRQAIALELEYAEAHNNLGVILKELGKLDEAEASYRQAIRLKSNYAEAHLNLASMKVFDDRDEQYFKMQELSFEESLSEDQRCQISFGLAKASEDLKDLEQAFKYYSEGNALRKKLLNYNISQDVELFKQLKASYPQIAKNVVEITSFLHRPMPIFIVGMPRSGTTLVEQIISSHSQVFGAGELPFVSQFGDSIARGLSLVDANSLLDFRQNYLAKLANISNRSSIVTDKMPQNFRYLGLLAAALPEAKIVHVTRNSAAVCWANFKQYFVTKSLGYCYALDDVTKYYGLYEDLMEFWGKALANRIYNLDYELLTVRQEDETRKLIRYLGLNWEEKCLSPQENKRSVATASNMQVRQKVYQGSSQQWKKFQPFLNGVFDYLNNRLER